jgi:hypothetical protein
MTPAPPLPDCCGVAFKEWAGVCEALESGRQSLILRKGGIAEGSNGFMPEHRTFWLYPTHLHEAQQGLKSDRANAGGPQATAGHVPLRSLAVVEQSVFVDQLGLLPALDEFHVWTADTIRKRFDYRSPGLWVLVIRTFVRPGAIEVPLHAEHAGCKSWVPIDPPLPTAGLVPVLDDAEFIKRRDRLLAALDSGR